jgi:cell shape-determining protein MreC
MAQIKFNHVFAGLMGLSVVTAFFLPQKQANRAHPEVQALFAPVAIPAGAAARWFHNRISPDISPDRRAAVDISRENIALWSENSRLTRQLQDLQEREQERSRLGSIKDLCTPFRVIGGDPGPRESLQILGSSLEGLRDKMYVLYGDGGIAGQIQRAGLAGAQVQLITDQGFRVRAKFIRFQVVDGQPRSVTVDAPQVVVVGSGKNRMVIRGPSRDQVTTVAVGDAVVLDESDWPSYLKGRYIGHVTAIGKRPDAPQFAEITVEPRETLLRLREVMVITKEGR